MKIFAIVPVKKFENAKTRLSPLLNEDDRVALSSVMLGDTLKTLSSAVSIIAQTIVVSSDARAAALSARHGVKFLHEPTDNGVNSAVSLADSYSKKEGAEATIVIPQDLPLMEAIDITMMCELAERENQCVVVCPSQRYDGTNALLRKPASVIPTHYDNDSYEAHVRTARDAGLPVRLFFSKRLTTDIDTPEDVKLLLRDAASAKSGNLTAEFLKSRIAF